MKCGDPCAWPGCDDNTILIRVNAKGKAGIFMCRSHAQRVANTDWWVDNDMDTFLLRAAIEGNQP